jgi:cell division transport system permease protein
MEACLNQDQIRRAEINQNSLHPILPRDTVAGHALVAVIAIMSFLAALAVGAVQIVRTTAIEWRADVAREMTIQVRPAENRDIEEELRKAIEIAKKVPGITAAQAYTKQEADKLLEPWLGAGFDLSTLPIPRLIKIRVQNISDADVANLRRVLSENVSGVTLDDHRNWSSRITAAANAIIFVGFAVLILVLITTVLSVSFATRGTVAANRAVVEVLHFVGARDSYIANVFQRHFLVAGLKGGVFGGVIAALLFMLLHFAGNFLNALPGKGDVAAFLSQFALNGQGYLGIAFVIGLVAFVTALSSRITVHRTLHTID